jgi:hypothetical protein
LGGDDTDSDGDEPLRAEEQAAAGAVGEVVEEDLVQAEPSSVLIPSSTCAGAAERSPSRRLDHISTPSTPMGKRKMCERCGLKQPFYGLIRRAGVGPWEGTARCAGCGAAEGAVSLRKRQMCEGCGLKVPNYGLASEGKARWCVGCGAAEGAVSLQKQKQKMCEGCGLKQPTYGLASEVQWRWCAGCGAAEGAVSLSKQKTVKTRLEKWPRGMAGVTVGAGAKQGARSVDRALEVLGGDDTDSDGDEAPQAEGEAAEEAVGEAAEEVKAEPAPALEPEIKREPSDRRRQQQQHQHEQEQPMCVRSAKRRAV